MTPEEWRDQVGRHVEARRRELGIRSMRAAVRGIKLNEATWRQVETGRRQISKDVVIAPSPEEFTQYVMARVLFWEIDWLERLLRGETPTVADLGSDESPPDDEVAVVLSRVVEELRGLRSDVQRMDAAVERLVAPPAPQPPPTAEAEPRQRRASS